jgi:soluble cytochrome b562
MGGIIMRWAAVWAVMMLVGLPALWARDDVKDKPKEPEKSNITAEVNAVIAAHQKAVNDYYKNIAEKSKNAKTDEERSKVYQGEAFPKPDETIDKLWALLEKNPKEKGAALTALQWLLNNYGYDDKGQKGRARAVEMLIKDHADDPNIAPVLSRLTYVPSAKVEELFRAVMAKNPAKDASTCLAPLPVAISPAGEDWRS